MTDSGKAPETERRAARLRLGDLLLAAGVLLAALLFGSLPTLAFSLCGGALSLATMLLLRRTGRFSVLGVSIAGAVCHNLGQLACAALLTGTAGLGWYLPVLLAAGCITGAAVGGAAALTVAALKPKNR